MEVEKKTKPTFGELEIRQELRFVNGSQGAHGLQLDNDNLLDEQVDPVGTVNLESTVDDRAFLLALDSQSPVDQLELQACLVRRFEQARPQLSMHGNSSRENLLRHLVASLDHSLIS